MRFQCEPGWVRDVFIETGTYEAESLRIAAAMPFKELHSVEVCKSLADNAARGFPGDGRVHVHHGSSPVILSQIIQPDRETLFWLDAHYQGLAQDQMDPVAGQCPLLAELAVILSAPWRLWPIILIDDAHCFGCSGGQPHPSLNLAVWPKVSQIVAILPNNYRMEVSGDVIRCLP